MSSTYAIGIDVGGSSLKCGLVKHTGEVVNSFLKPLDGAYTEQAVISLIAEVIQQCAAAAGSQAVTGVGIGFPGIVEDHIVIGGADNLPGFENLPLGEILKQQTGFDIVIDNDANMMSLGELAFGSGKGCTDIVFLTVGTGIGGAVVINGKLYGGYRNRGGELGHIILQHNGESCSCGASGCFEAYASVTALIRQYKKLDSDLSGPVNGKLITEKYLQQEANAVLAMHHHFDYMAAGIAGLVNIFSPQKVVIGGGISEAGSFYIDEIETRVRNTAMPAAFAHTTITAASLGNQAGLLGCAAKVFNEVS
ncbi:ROK family protein [Niabella hirudinis]|uniref:ROK family protein n=1 Tax=Niabella hirudinis TaxID=1285929 RepID=UPI003EBF71B8